MLKPPKPTVAVILAVVLSACVSTGRFKKTVSERDALNARVAELSAQSADLEARLAEVQKEKNALIQQSEQSQAQYQQLVGQLSEEVQKGELKVTEYKNMLTVDVAEQIFFDSGKSALKPTAGAVLSKLSEALKSYPDKIIRVVGHTDNVPFKKGPASATNWELSVARATNVVRFLQETGGVEPERLIASGRGEYSPVAPNDTPEGRQKNRRIEIILMDKNILEALSEPAK